jgi:hypothetical protein
MDNRLDKIEEQLDGIKALLLKLNNNIESIKEKMEDLEESLDDELIPECKKMGSHIVFIESVYDTVKHPLGYLCNKIKSLSGKNDDYTLTDISNNETLEN